MRTIAAAIAGSLLGIIIKPQADQANTIGITILVGIIFYYYHTLLPRKAERYPKIKRKNYKQMEFRFYFHAINIYGNIYRTNQHTVLKCMANQLVALLPQVFHELFDRV
jgi:hypothetical protein